MRAAFAVALLLAAGAMAAAQPPQAPQPRYGVKPRVKAYPQASPREALRSALAAADAADYAYLVAQLLDPKFVDAAVADRAKGFEGSAEIELAKLRDFQRANASKIAPEDRVPQDPREFRALAAAKARDLGFRHLVRDVAQKLGEDPQAVKDLGRILRDGSFAPAEAAATAAHPDVKNRTLFFKSIDGRWFLENRQAEEKKE
jgi:hypothetical protein